MGSDKKSGEPAVDRPALWKHEDATAAASLSEIRAAIDAVDREIVRLLAERLRHTRDAARFKTDEGEVEAPKRVEEVVAKVKARAAERGVPAEIVEPVYRALIAASIEDQRRLFRRVARP